MNNFTRTRNNTNVWGQMTELRSNEPFLQFSYKAMIKATDFLTNHKTQDPQGSKVDVGLDDEIKRLVLPETLSEVAS
ncbi:MAG: hypothetical protein NZO16_08120, partial [Deltaproteobacteria bacterium]|nr:hypothetical protein [Deltaproteobacteria bacterium]